MEVFVAGKLEIANSHTVMTKEELLDIYLQEGITYFQINEQDLPPTLKDEGNEGADANQPNNSNINDTNNPLNADPDKQQADKQPNGNSAGQNPDTQPAGQPPGKF